MSRANRMRRDRSKSASSCSGRVEIPRFRIAVAPSLRACGASVGEGRLELSSFTRRSFVQAGAAGAAAQVPAGSAPNVLFIMLDQWRFDCLGANGNTILQTPHLDRLASRSANFTQA